MKWEGYEYTVQPRMFISFNGKTFKVGDKAIINEDEETSTITNIGKKLILLRKDLQSKEKRVPVEMFFRLNA
jgi:hypothetical protein